MECMPDIRIIVHFPSEGFDTYLAGTNLLPTLFLSETQDFQLSSLI